MTKCQKFWRQNSRSWNPNSSRTQHTPVPSYLPYPYLLCSPSTSCLSLSLAARPTLGAPASSSSERASRPPLADRASGRRSLPPSPPPCAQPGRASSSSGAGSVPQREGTDGGRGGAGAGEVPQPNGARRQRGASVEPSRGGWVDADGEPAAEGPGHRYRPGFLNSCRLAKTDPAAVTQLMSSCRLVPASEYMMMLPELLFFFLLRFD